MILIVDLSLFSAGTPEGNHAHRLVLAHGCYELQEPPFVFRQMYMAHFSILHGPPDCDERHLEKCCSLKDSHSTSQAVSVFLDILVLLGGVIVDACGAWNDPEVI